MICENTISAGFYFMLGKFLFDIAVIGVIAVSVIAFWLAVEWFTGRKA